LVWVKTHLGVYTLKEGYLSLSGGGNRERLFGGGRVSGNFVSLKNQNFLFGSS